MESPQRLTGENIRQWKEIVPPLSDDIRRQLEEIFGRETLSLFGEEKKGRRSLAESFLALIFDPGLRREGALEGEEPLSPVYVLNRQGGLLLVKRKLDVPRFDFFSPVKFLKLDIADLFSANQVQEERGGDYLLNKAARTILSLIEEDEGIKKKTVFFREGGDEFCLALMNDWKEEEIDRLLNRIKIALSQQTVYYQENGQTVKRGIVLNERKTGLVDPAQLEDNEKEVFFSQLNRNNILSTEEVRSEVERRQQREKQRGKKETALDEGGFDLYPQEVDTTEEKIDYLLQIHPELKVPFYLASYLDQKDGGGRKELFLSVIEGYFLDPLLRRIVLTRWDLESHLQREEFSEIFAFELKLKEINEREGYFYADNLIKKLAEELKNIMGDYWERIKIGRFGGLIFLAVPKEMILTEETRHLLLNLGKIDLEDLSHFVGVANIETEGKEARSVLRELFSSPTLDWLAKNIEYIKEKNLWPTFIQCFTEGGETDDLTLQRFLDYFSGKRREIRLEQLLEYIKSLPLREEEKKQLKEALKTANNSHK